MKRYFQIIYLLRVWDPQYLIKLLQLNNERIAHYNGFEQTFLHKRYTDDKYAHEMILNAISHQKNVNHNHNVIPLHTHQDGYYEYQKVNNNKSWVQRNWKPHILLVGIGNDASILKNSLIIPQRLESYHLTQKYYS